MSQHLLCYIVFMSKRAEEIVKRVNATMILEGLPLDEEDKEFIAKYIDGEMSLEEAIAILNARFTVNG